MDRQNERREDPNAGKTTRVGREFETFEIDWRGMRIGVCFEREFLGEGEPSPYNFCHLQIETLAPPRAPLPMSATGYRSHFMNYDRLMQQGGPLAYVQAWLEIEAQSPQWAAYESASRQLTLFLGVGHARLRAILHGARQVLASALTQTRIAMTQSSPAKSCQMSRRPKSLRVRLGFVQEL